MDTPRLRLRADFGASPLWTDEGLLAIEALSLSPRLSAEPQRWADDFSATAPRDRRMKSAGEVPRDWTERGHRLAGQLQAEVGEAFLVVHDG